MMASGSIRVPEKAIFSAGSEVVFAQFCRLELRLLSSVLFLGVPPS
jgi:hypothetical protein